MLLRFASVVVLTMSTLGAAPALAASAVEQGAALSKDAKVLEVLAITDKVDAALLAHDAAGFEGALSPELVVNNPINTVTTYEGVVQRFRNDQIRYGAYERKIEFAGVRGDDVVVMGEEINTPMANTPNAGKTVHRRFTDIWKKQDGAWKLVIRQATVISAK